MKQFLSAILILLPLLASAHVLPQQRVRGAEDIECGIQTPPSTLIQAVEALQPGTLVDENIQVTVHMHVAVAENASDSYGSNEILTQQFAILQDTYAQYGIDLTLGEITRERSDSISNMDVWYLNDDGSAFTGSKPEINDWLQRTRTGNYECLHIYWYQALANATGFCNMPDPGRPPSEFWLDACHLRIAALPGGSQAFRGGGLSAVHEVGHWFGLFHTFQGGCEGDGDFVDDTPAQKTQTVASDICPWGQDTCPDLPGIDLINNFMDYSADACRGNFTAGQQARMHNLYQTIRAGN